MWLFCGELGSAVDSYENWFVWVDNSVHLYKSLRLGIQATLKGPEEFWLYSEASQGRRKEGSHSQPTQAQNQTLLESPAQEGKIKNNYIVLHGGALVEVKAKESVGEKDDLRWSNSILIFPRKEYRSIQNTNVVFAGYVKDAKTRIHPQISFVIDDFRSATCYMLRSCIGCKSRSWRLKWPRRPLERPRSFCCFARWMFCYRTRWRCGCTMI